MISRAARASSFTCSDAERRLKPSAPSTKDTGPADSFTCSDAERRLKRLLNLLQLRLKLLSHAVMTKGV